MASGPTNLKDLDLSVLRRAIDVFLARAYPEGVIPEVVKRRLEWPAGGDPETLLGGPPFERSGRNSGTGASIYALRLGNARYPHMKLQIQPWPNPAGFLLSVNTHDQVAGLEPDAADLPAFRALQAENQRLKEEIEHAWDAEGLPTFVRYLREYLEHRPGPEDGSDAPVPA